ncbi:MAG: ribosome small subunit-dependent GTPase A, partial [Actinomycetes bacterium]
MTPRSRRRLDESDIRVRPNPKGSRPRTKERPRHEDAVPARVLTVDRGRYTTLVDEGTDDERVVVAMKARELGRASIVVGDRVALVGDVSGIDDTLARVVRVADRATVLRRTADDTDPVERVVVANADQLVVVTAVADPEPRHRMVDRCLVAAYDAGIAPLLVLTKADLADPAEFLGAYRDLDLTVVVTRRRHDRSIEGLDDVREHLRGHDSVLVGHSGVGKSTLVNALVPAADRATGIVNAVTGR